MAIKVPATRQALADTYKTQGASISLHTADPGTTGASEAAGGGYARQTTTWTSGSGGALTGSQVSFTLAAGTYTHIGLWGAGGYVDGAALSAPITLSEAATLQVTPSFTES